MRRTISIALAGPCLIACLASGAARGAEFYVAPSGTTSTGAGTGTPSVPWSLQTALSHPAAVRPGDTIWLAGGTYAGTYTSSLAGTASAPIVVRAMPGARATLDGGNSNGEPILTVGGTYTWYWGFEVTSSDPVRQSAQNGPWPTDIGRGEGIQILQSGSSGTGTKFINLVVHDTRQGFSWWTNAQDSEISGCLSYYNGWRGATDRGHGHGAYIQNQFGTKLVEGSIVFRNFSHGLHAYGSDTAHLDGIGYVGDTVFSNGEPGGSYERNLLIGGGVVAQSPRLEANATWAPWGNDVNALGYAAGCVNASVTGNYLVGAASPLRLVACSTGMTMTANSFIAMYPTDGFSGADYPSNTYTTSTPTDLRVFVRSNRYEAGRANITVYAWDGRTSAAVDVSGVLAPGATYEVRDAQNFFGAPVAAGTYAGGAITLPLANLPPAVPVGMAPLQPTGPQFNAFVLLTTGSAACAPVVTPPAPVSLDQTTCCGLFGGATPAASAALSAFLDGGSATDACGGMPARLAPQVAGTEVTGATCFPAGTTAVTFRFQDSSGAVGTATATATVRMFGDLDLDGVVTPADMVVLRGYLNFSVTPGAAPFAAPAGSGDLTHDGAVDPSDLVALRGYLNFALACLAPG